MIGHGRKGTWVLLPVAVWLIASTASTVTAEEPAAVSVPLVNTDGGVGLTIAPVSGVDVSAEVIAGGETDGTATRLTFNNPRLDRRLVALEGMPAGPIEGARVLAFDCTLSTKLTEQRTMFGPLLSMIAVFFENDGGAWYRVVGKGLFYSSEIRVPMRGTFHRARFATDPDDEIRREQVERVWLGVVDDGPMVGTFEVRRVRFTDEPFRPKSPVRFGEKWEVAQDPAVNSKLTVQEEFPLGASYEFEIPGSRHMYAMIRTPVEVQELDAYSALQFHTYMNELPEGIDGLLVMLIERDGTQYRAVPAPTATEEQQTITIPFDQFERGSWSKDENDQLDLEQVSHVAIGMHGTTPKAASGMINISSVQFLP